MPAFAIIPLALTLIMLVPAAAAESWHVRIDGGSAEQCTGRVDAAYSGTGKNQACAWSHPFIALPPGGPATISGGDTLHIGSGDYMMGYGAPDADSCHQSIAYNCFMARIPSGPSPSRPTRILGAGHDQGCTRAPELWGTESAWMVVNMEGSSNVELACLEITDRGSCILSHCQNGKCGGEVAACNQTTPPLGKWATTGISARDSSQVMLRDVNIHGLANRGIHAGRISDWTLERVVIRANGWAGWDGDIGPDSANRGTLIFRQVEIGFNGCAERWPGGEIFGCWAQGSAGYGDGLGTGETVGHWIFEDSQVHHNTSDGIDLLYLTDGGRVTIKRSWFEGNAGNQVKVSRVGRISDNVIIGNCGYFSVGHPNMLDSDHCRSLGDAVYVGLSDGAQTELIDNLIMGQGNCLVSSGESDRRSRLLLAGNLMIGSDYWHDRSKKSCLFHTSSRHGVVDWQANTIDQVRHRHCPAGSHCGAKAIRDDGRLERIEINQGQLPLRWSSD